MDRTKSLAASLVYHRLNDDFVLQMGGLTDHHIKFISFFVKERLGFEKYRFEMRYSETPKRFIIHLFDSDENEMFLKLKPHDILDKIKETLELSEWKIEVAKNDKKL